MTATQKRIVPKNAASTKDYFQGAVLDENGREIPITRDMKQDACQQLEESREYQDLNKSLELAHRRKGYS